METQYFSSDAQFTKENSPLRKLVILPLKDAGHYVKNYKAHKGKILSLHAHEVACISIGRVFQIGRIGGNFLILLYTGIQLSDKKAVKPMIEKHEELFGADTLESFAADRGYYSKNNIKVAQKKRA